MSRVASTSHCMSHRTCSIVSRQKWGSSARNLDGASTELGMSVCSSETRIVLVGTRGWHQNGLDKGEYGSHVEEINETFWSRRTNIISWPCVFGMYSTWMQIKCNNPWTVFQYVWITYFCWSNWKAAKVWERHAKTVAWSYDMEGHAQNCVERCCELAKKKKEQLYKVANPCLDDHNFKKEELETVRQLNKYAHR